MTTIPLRQLVREPTRVKELTRAGQSVRVTDNGKPLWIIQPAAQRQDETERREAIDAMLDQMLAEPISRLSLSQIVKDSRR
jgi:antitoxin (DNA-binding transcriptional repressor) of toxin-antitoxin stability system